MKTENLPCVGGPLDGHCDTVHEWNKLAARVAKALAASVVTAKEANEYLRLKRIEERIS